MNIKDEILHHIFPSASGTSLMLTLGEHFLFSVATGVAIYVITHTISFLTKSVLKKFRCPK
jgi:hypothetical protein